jgi:hypothetical protein
MQILKTPPLQALFLALAPLLCGAALAQAPQAGGKKQGPPAQAIAACKSLSTGQDCTFTDQQRSLRGTCWAPEGKPLACRPAQAPMGNNQPANQ